MERNLRPLYQQADMSGLIALLNSTGVYTFDILEICGEEFPDYEIELTEIANTLNEGVDCGGERMDFISRRNLDNVLGKAFGDIKQESYEEAEEKNKFCSDMISKMADYNLSFHKDFLNFFIKGAIEGNLSDMMYAFRGKILKEIPYKIPKDFIGSKEVQFYKNISKNLENYDLLNFEKNKRESEKWLETYKLFHKGDISQEEKDAFIETSDKKRFEDDNKKLNYALNEKNVAELEYPSKEVFTELVRRIKAGENLSNFMLIYSDLFPRYQREVVNSGESCSILDFNLRKLAGYIKVREALRRNYNPNQ
ncbi:MAG: type II secretion system F family protein [Candidatus Nanoarchaeia archaeon]|nr:type II secretion system F family protein [Candidatus Nanoarchaeia archaeon]MDD5740990.1 type II secretion system F family protein [Candidatus Nanoarchaeia archaeon]